MHFKSLAIFAGLALAFHVSGCRGTQASVTVRTTTPAAPRAPRPPAPPPPPRAPSTSATIVIRPAPPRPPAYSRPAVPGAGYIWCEGHYDWRGNQYVWVHGRWQRLPAGRTVW